MFELTVSERKRAGKKDLKTLRAEGFMPAVIYGRKEPTTSIKLPQLDFKKVFKQAGESTIITLKGLDEDKDVLVHDIDLDPLTDEPRHADFYAVEKGRKITVDVPLEFVGIAPAVKELGGILVKVLYELEIEVLPKDLPQHIEVDVSPLTDFETSLHVKDLVLPEGVTSLVDGEEVVAAITHAVEEVEEEVVEEPDMDAIEVEKKGKDDATEEESEEAK